MKKEEDIINPFLKRKAKEPTAEPQLSY